MTPEVERGHSGLEVVACVDQASVAHPDRPVDEIALYFGAALRKTHDDASGVDDGVVNDPAHRAPIDVDPIVGAGRDEIGLDRSLALLERACAIPAELGPRSAAAERDADTPARLTRQRVFAEHHVALEPVVRTSALHE